MTQTQKGSTKEAERDLMAEMEKWWLNYFQTKGYTVTEPEKAVEPKRSVFSFFPDLVYEAAVNSLEKGDTDQLTAINILLQAIAKHCEGVEFENYYWFPSFHEGVYFYDHGSYVKSPFNFPTEELLGSFMKLEHSEQLLKIALGINDKEV